MSESSANPLAERVIQLELVATHLERDLDTLNAVVLDQQKQLDVLRRLVKGIDDRVTRLADDDESRDPAEERPPHY